MVKRVQGGDRLRAHIRELRGRTVQDVSDELSKSVERIRTNVVADIRIQKIPAGYAGTRRGGPGRRKHIPSPPWGPPNSDTGNLIGRYTTKPAARVGSLIVAAVVAGVRYAKWLEDGTKRMLPRPHLLPRFEQEVTKLKDRLRKITKG